MGVTVVTIACQLSKTIKKEKKKKLGRFNGYPTHRIIKKFKEITTEHSQNWVIFIEGLPFCQVVKITTRISIKSPIGFMISLYLYRPLFHWNVCFYCVRCTRDPYWSHEGFFQLYFYVLFFFIFQILPCLRQSTKHQKQQNVAGFCVASFKDFSSIILNIMYEGNFFLSCK